MKRYLTSRIGEEYGDLLIIDGSDTKRHVMVKCKICGREFIKNYQHLKNLKGCEHWNCSRQLPDIKAISKSSFYSSWANLRTRTTNKNYEKYEQYGGRGINSDEFEHFIDFYDKMYESYLKHVDIYGDKNVTIERIDVDGHYCKANCKWATWNEQAKNKTNTLNMKVILPNKEIVYIDDFPGFCKEHGLKDTTIRSNLHKNMKKGKNSVGTRAGYIFELV